MRTEKQKESHRVNQRRWTKKNPEKVKKINQEQYEKNREEIRAQQNEYHARNIDTIMIRKDKHYQDNKEEAKDYAKKHRKTMIARLTSAKRRAKKKGFEYGLDLEWAEALPLICHWTGDSLTLDTHSGYSASLDRVDSSKGYTKENTVLCCWRINQMKNDMSVDEMHMWMEKALKHRQVQLKEAGEKIN